MQGLTGSLFRAEWHKQLAVALVYGILVFLFRLMAVPHYLLLSGVQVAALLVTPYRYWPGMMFTEFLTRLPVAFECEPSFGMLWSELVVVPGIVLSGPVVYLFREHLHLFDREGWVRIGKLVACALVVSLVMAGFDLVQLSTVVYPPGVKPLQYHYIGAQWILGCFLGILTVAPPVLAVRHVLTNGWRRMLRDWIDGKALVESIFLTISALTIIWWIGFSKPELRSVAQAAMFIPVVWLALLHGWKGIAWGGAAASLALISLMPKKYDVATIQAEVFIVLAIVPLLLVGARMDSLNRLAEQEYEDARAKLALAQRHVHLGELQLRTIAQTLEQVRETVRNGFAMMMGRLRHLQPAIDDAGYRRVAQFAQDQLAGIADSLHPAVWRDRGLPAALREGAVARMLNQAGIRYRCEHKGPLSCLSKALHKALYRMVCEAIAEGCTDKDVSEVCVLMRVGCSDGRYWVVASVTFRSDPIRLPHVRWDELLPQLKRAANGMDLRAVKDRAEIFEGYARERMQRGGRRISWLMRDVLVH